MSIHTRKREISKRGLLTAGKYELVELLGRGNSSSVYSARDWQHEGRLVTLKTYDDPVEDTLFERMVLEAATYRQVDHPQLLIPSELCRDAQKYLYLESAIVPGISAARMIRSGDSLDWLQVVPIIEDLLGILVALEEKGLIHHQLTPANIFIGERVYLTDCGKLQQELQQSLAWSDASFVAPETLQLGICNARSNLFSVGALAYALSEGMPPTRPLKRIPSFTTSAKTDPSNQTAPWFAEMIRKLLAEDPDQRYRSAKELLTRLEQIRLRQRRSIPHGTPPEYKVLEPMKQESSTARTQEPLTTPAAMPKEEKHQKRFPKLFFREETYPVISKRIIAALDETQAYRSEHLDETTTTLSSTPTADDSIETEAETIFDFSALPPSAEQADAADTEPTEAQATQSEPSSSVSDDTRVLPIRSNRSAPPVRKARVLPERTFFELEEEWVLGDSTTEVAKNRTSRAGVAIVTGLLAVAGVSTVAYLTMPRSLEELSVSGQDGPVVNPALENSGDVAAVSSNLDSELKTLPETTAATAPAQSAADLLAKPIIADSPPSPVEPPLSVAPTAQAPTTTNEAPPSFAFMIQRAKDNQSVRLVELATPAATIWSVRAAPGSRVRIVIVGKSLPTAGRALQQLTIDQTGEAQGDFSSLKDAKIQNGNYRLQVFVNDELKEQAALIVTQSTYKR